MLEEEDDEARWSRARHGASTACSPQQVHTPAGLGARWQFVQRGEEASERRKKKMPCLLRSPIYRGGVVTGALNAVMTHAGRIACGKITLWPRVCACRQSTGMGHRIIYSSTHGI